MSAASNPWLAPRTRAPGRPRRQSPALPMLLAGSLAITANITGVIQPAEAAPRPKEPAKPSVADRGKTVREAFEDAKRAASKAAVALRATLTPPSLYTVQQGDTLFIIADRYGLNLAKLLALNGLSWRTVLQPGQIIKLTAAGPVEAAAPLPDLVPADQRHTVRKGESLSAIAAAYDIRLDWILSANGLSTASIIYPGQVITIPAGAPTGVVQTGSGSSGSSDSSGSSGSSGSSSSSGSVVALPSEMRTNAKIIISVGRSLGVPDYGIVIALATAAQESTLRNLDWGDRDSVGLFQQRPSQGWGTVAELTDPAIATTRFFKGNPGYTRGLLGISGWQDMELTVAAQKVQISAYPDAYAKWEASARAWLKELG